LFKTLSNPSKRESVFVEWRGKGFDTDVVRAELGAFLPDAFVDEVVFDYHAFITKGLLLREE
jgi:hypothetical protein